MAAKEPPKWAHANACHGCQKAFTLIARKHHCRNCGNTFCANCSQKKIPIPEFGLVTPERVCDKCYDLIKADAGQERTSERRERKPKDESGEPASPSTPPSASSSAASGAAPSEGKSEAKDAKKAPVRRKDCTCGAPLCVCADDKPVAQEPVKEKEKDAPVSPTPKAKPVSKADSNYSSGVTGPFLGFGLQSQKQWDLKGNLNDQCRDAIKAGDFEGVKQLIKAGAKADFKDRTGNTLVHLAAMFNRLDMVEFLYQNGADLTIKNPDNESPIDLAPPALATKMRAMAAGK